MSLKQAILSSLGWVALSILFCLGVYQFLGADKACSWMTCYIVEKSLSVDNLLVFSLLFTYFCVETKDQPKFLYYGILGSMIMRGAFIGVGLGLIQSFHALYYACGVFLLYTSVKMLTAGDDDGPKFNQSWAYKLLIGKVSLFWLIVAVLEATDIAFATDSVPAAMSISQDPFIVWTSNILAVCGLRSMYFVLVACMDRLAFLKYGVSLVLCLIGLKMLAPIMSTLAAMQTGVWLLIVGSVLGASCICSLIWNREPDKMVIQQ